MQTAKPNTDESTLGAQHGDEVRSGERFEFGDNWRHFLAVLDDERIAQSERSLQEMLATDRLDGLTFLDAGSGSGLSSLAAFRLGAGQVQSFDYDPASVACTAELRRRFAEDSRQWTVEAGSVLDRSYLGGLGTFDVVYSWGVLHHTGDMWTALDNVSELVAPGGRLFIAIYNDQGSRSVYWRRIKRLYNALPLWARNPYAIAVSVPGELGSLARFSLRLNPRGYIRTWTDYKAARGMSRWHDIVDWVGGYPFEVATPDAVFEFLRKRGFALERLVTRQGSGCNEFVLRRPESD